MPQVTAADVRKMSLSQRGSLKKDDLLNALNDALANYDSSSAQPASVNKILEKLDAIHTEMTGMRKNFDELRARQDALSKENELLRGAVMQHQRFMESIDAEKRGMSEGAMEVEGLSLQTDGEKIAHIESKLNCPGVRIDTITRLGREASTDPRRPRPIKLVLHDAKTRATLLKKAKELKDKREGVFNNVTFKKDVHPKIRQEYKRLHDVEEAEKRRPENAGKIVRYIHANRCVMVGETVVDRFQPQFF